MARAPKDVLVVCLDVGLGMQAHAPGSVSALDQSSSIISMVIQRKIFAESKDLVALVLFGCEETSNQLADEDDGSYSNISVVFPLGVSNFDLLDYMTNSIKPGNTKTDFLDALTVCLDLLHSETRSDKKIDCRRIALFTNFDHRCSDDNIDGIVSGFTADEMIVKLTTFGPSIQMDPPMKAEHSSSDDEAGPSTSKRRRLDCEAPSDVTMDESTRKPKSSEQLAGEELIRQMFRNGVAGMSYPFSHASKAVTGFEKRSVRSAAWKCPLTLGTDLSIPCVAYAKTKEARMKQTWKKCHAKTHKVEDIMTNSYYHANDEDQTEVPLANVGKGYRYGKDIIPFSAEDEKQLKYQTDGKSLSILGFTDVKNVPPQLHMDDQAHYVLPEKGDKAAATGLYALIVALQRQSLCAIACYVYRRGSNPKLVALMPRIRPDYKCLVMVALPFAEDVRQLAFPPMPQSMEPSQQQLDSIDHLIDTMDLTDKSNDEELYDPKEMLNPSFQYAYQCLHSVSMRPPGAAQDLERPSYDPLAPNPAVMERSKAALQNVKKLFKLEKRDPEEARRTVSRWKKYDSKDEATTEGDATSGPCKPLVTITAPAVEKVGTVSPQEDFTAMLANKPDDAQRVSSAFEQLQKRVEDFVSDPFALKLSSKIVASLRVMIAHAQQHNQVDNVNSFLIKMKTKLLRSNAELWKFLVESDINLIGDGDYDGTNRSNFRLEGIPPCDVVSPKEEEEQEEAEDLLDLID